MPWQNLVSAILRAVIALVAFAVSLVATFAGGLAALLTFTVQSNLMLAVSFGWTAWTLLRDVRTPPEWLAGSSVFYISITGIIYNLVIDPGKGSIGEPIIFGLDNSQLAHGFSPVAAVVVWLVFAEHRRIPWKYAVWWLGYVVVYISVILAIIAWVPGFHVPYPFLDVSVLGWSGVFRNLGVYFAGFIALSVAMVFLDRKILPARTPISEFDAHDQDE